MRGHSHQQSHLIGIGIDIIETERIRLALNRRGRVFLERVFSPEELRQLPDGAMLVPRVAARFAAKEAVLKALGCGLSGVSWREVEILGQTPRAPKVRLSGKAASLAESMGVREVLVSMSHSREYAVAQVVALGSAREKDVREG